MIQKLFKGLIDGQKQVFSLLESELASTPNDDEIIDFLLKIDNKSCLSNSAIAKKAADYLQLLNEEKNYTQLSLEDIGQIYCEIIKVHPYDITFYESAYYFFDSVIGNSLKANEILIQGLEKIEAHIKKLKESIK